MKKTTMMLAVALSAGCAGTYRPPVAQPQITEANVSANKQSIMAAAKLALASDGFQLTLADSESGIISTAPLNMRLTPSQANCGTSMGLDYLKDTRTSTRVSFNVIAEDGSVKVRAAIQGEYRPGDVAQDITLTCVSHGVIEKDLIAKISAGS